MGHRTIPPHGLTKHSSCLSCGQVHPSLVRVMHPHQRDGVRWLWDAVRGRHRKGCCGGILGDDVGLGKTLQTIALLLTLVEHSQATRVLICVPATLVDVWHAEFRKWLKVADSQLDVVRVSREEQHDRAKAVLGRLRATTAPLHLVVIIGYDQVRLCTGPFLGGLSVDVLVLDEAHHLKSRTTRRARAIATIPARARILMTATPIANRMSELEALLSQAAPGIFSNPAFFRMAIAQPVEAITRDGASANDHR